MGGRTSTSDSRRSEKESESQETPRRAAEPRSASFVDVFSTFPGERAGRAKTLKGRPGVLRVSSVKRSMPSALRHEPLHPRRLAGANEPPNPRESGESPRESRKNVHGITPRCPGRHTKAKGFHLPKQHENIGRSAPLKQHGNIGEFMQSEQHEDIGESAPSQMWQIKRCSKKQLTCDKIGRRRGSHENQSA